MPDNQSLATFLASPYLEPLPGFPPNPIRLECLPKSVITGLEAFEKQRLTTLQLLHSEIANLIKVPARLVTRPDKMRPASLIDADTQIDVGDPHSANDEGIDFSEYEDATARFSGIPKDDWQATTSWEQKVISLAASLNLVGQSSCTIQPPPQSGVSRAL